MIKNLLLREELVKSKLGTIKGIMIGGSTGTGKTTYINKLSIDVSHSHHIVFKIISSTQLLSKVVGGAEEYVRKLF